MGTLIILNAVAYGVLFHTSIPLRIMANRLKTAENGIDLNYISGSALDLNHISGSVANGFAVKEVVLKGEADEPDSRLEGVTFRFNGFLDVFLNKRLIIDEISVKRADLIVKPNVLEVNGFEFKDKGYRIAVWIGWTRCIVFRLIFKVGLALLLISLLFSIRCND